MSEDPRLRTTAVPAHRVLQGAMRPRANLRVVMPAGLSPPIVLGKERLVLGRQAEEEGGPALLHEAVSRRHFAVEWDAAAGGHAGVDLGSSNGSFVDGARASEARPLADGSVIRLGPSVLLVYEAGSAAPSGDDAPQVSREALPGDAAATRVLRSKIGKIAPDPSPVLLFGETGTGKELLAGEIHRLSGRAGKLIAVNCAALSPQLVESQLFGHMRGAFTGAHDAQPGLFREADGGTLFLDEIGELPPELQPKLLRAIQEREIRPVGGAKNVRVDVRIVAATNRDLAAEVERGTFRRDLYARLSLWEIDVPAVRARRADLLMWIDRLHRRWLGERGKVGGGARASAGGAAVRPLEFDGAAAEALLLAEWPDNLRGLDRLVHALASSAPARGDGDGGGGGGGAAIGLEDLPEWISVGSASAATHTTATTSASPTTSASTNTSTAGQASTPGKGGVGTPVVGVKLPVPTKEELAAVLERLDGSVRATAKHFGRDRKQIYRWLEAHGLKARSED